MGMPKHDHGDDHDVMRHSQSAFLRSPSDAGEVESASRSASRELPTVHVSRTASVSRTTSSGQLSLADGGDAADGGGDDGGQAAAPAEPAIGPLNRREAFLSVPPSTAHGHSHSEGDRFCYLDHGDGGADGSPSGTFGTLAPVPSDDDDLDADVDPASFDIRCALPRSPPRASSLLLTDASSGQHRPRFWDDGVGGGRQADARR